MSRCAEHDAYVRLSVLERLFTILFSLVGIIGTAFSGVPPNLPFTLRTGTLMAVGGGLSGGYFTADGRIGWVLNPDGTVLATRDGGDAWQPQPSPATAGLNSITFAADDVRVGWSVKAARSSLRTTVAPHGNRRPAASRLL